MPRVLIHSLFDDCDSDRCGCSMSVSLGFGGRFGEDLGEFGRFWSIRGQILGILTRRLVVQWHCLWGRLEKCGPAGGKLISWTPALIREASQFEFKASKAGFCSTTL